MGEADRLAPAKAEADQLTAAKAADRSNQNMRASNLPISSSPRKSSPDSWSKQTVRASSLPISSTCSPRKSSPDSPLSSSRSPDSLQSKDDDMTDSMGDDGLELRPITKETFSRAKRMNDIVTADIGLKFNERALTQELGDLTSSALEEQMNDIDLAVDSTELRKDGWSKSPPGLRAQLEQERQELQGVV